MDFPRGRSGSGDEETSNSNKGRKQYHRHSLLQIQQLEAFFRLCPHPDENQRHQLSTELGLETKQIKFWFQNKRTQTKAQNERADNSSLQSENERIQCENLAMQEALKNIICPSCNGSVLGEEDKRHTLQRLRIENIQLKKEHDRLINIISNHMGKSVMPPLGNESSANVTGNHFLGAETSGVSLDHEVVPWNSQTPTARPHLSETRDIDRTIIIETVIAAMDELLELLHVNEPVWTKSTIDGRYLLHRDSYDKLFPKANHYKSATARTESTKDTGEVLMDPLNLIEMLLDSNKWKDLFPTIVTKARTIEVIDTGSIGGSLHLMYEKLHILSPLVSTREFFFIRYLRQLNSKTWVMVDLSNDFTKELQDVAPTRSWKLPSGCMIQDLSNGKSAVTWIEHVQVDDKSSTHRLYRDLVFGCQAYGARRWIVSLQRMCERFAFSTGRITRQRHELERVIDSSDGRRNLMELSHRMIKNFFEILSMSDKLEFPHLSALNNGGVRISLRKSNGQGQPNGLVVCAAASLWLPRTFENLFNFFRDEKIRAQWDVLSNGSPVHAIAQISTGMHNGNCISIQKPFVPRENNILMLQETTIDSLGAMMIYAPIDLPAITSAVNGEDVSKIPILPSGYIISGDGRAEKGGGASTSTGQSHSNGSLLTIAFQILVCGSSSLSKQLNMESIATVQSLISTTIQKIKVALDCSELD